MMRPLQSALATIERVVTSIAVICLFAIMLIVVADVFMRYMVNRPFSFTYALVGLYLMAGLFYLALSDTFAIHAHISVDILVHRFSPSVRCGASGRRGLPGNVSALHRASDRDCDPGGVSGNHSVAAVENDRTLIRRSGAPRTSFQ
jgi:Tripartite ATP-independent periplasmic transporters, DctQ component